MKAASLIGSGFYGVDLKEQNGRVYVIEVNDNPNVDAGVEDRVIGTQLYDDIIGYLRRGVDAVYKTAPLGGLSDCLNVSDSSSNIWSWIRNTG